MIKLTPEKMPYYENVEQTKTYKALLNQTGTEAPIATILKNTLNGTPILTFDDDGSYIATLPGAFPLGKTAMIIQNNTSGGIGNNYITENDANSILIETMDFTFTPQNDLLINTYIEITVYP